MQLSVGRSLQMLIASELSFSGNNRCNLAANPIRP